jgi:hypothetical protein
MDTSGLVMTEGPAGGSAPTVPVGGIVSNARLGARVLPASSFRAMVVVELGAARSAWVRWGPLRAIPVQPGQAQPAPRNLRVEVHAPTRVHEFLLKAHAVPECESARGD